MSDRVLLKTVIEIRHGLQSLGQCSLKRAGATEVTILEICHKGLLETDVLVEHEIKLARSRINRSVKDNSPHVPRKSVDVESTD